MPARCPTPGEHGAVLGPDLYDDALRAEIDRGFADAAVAYLHLHTARRGCFLCRVEWAD